MKSMAAGALMAALLVVAAFLAGDACDPAAQEMMARMRMQQMLGMYPNIYQDLLQGRLVPNGRGNTVLPNQQQQFIPGQQQQFVPGQQQLVPQQGQFVPQQGQFVPQQGQVVVPQNG